MELYHYQREGIAWLASKRSALLADEPGLGKTAQAAVALKVTGAYPALIVCPASVKATWARELVNWTQVYPHTINAGYNHIPHNAQAVIVNYDLLKAVGERRFKSVVFDEFFYCKNAEAKRTQHAAAIAARAERVYALSGTPIINRPAELVSQLDILGYLQQFGGKWPFIYRYCSPIKKRIRVYSKQHRRVITREILDISGSSRLEELHARLSELCMLRRTREQVAGELPKSLALPVTFTLDAAGRRLYEQACGDLRAWIAANKGAEAARKASYAEKLTRLTYLRQVAAQAKHAQMIEWISNLLETDEKVVLFAQSRALQQALLKEWPNAARLLGEDSSSTRQTNIDRLRLDPTCKVFVCSLKAGAFGTDGLQHGARYAVFCDLGDTSKIHEQAVARLDRGGQTRQVLAYYLLAENTVEEKIMARLLDKHQVTSVVSDGRVIDSLLSEAAET